ncbi:tripartite tricarboxylate transporter substrate-binding protein [Pseudoroseomonas ludipueritiae]|uniref:tripartite tricarboxylate transporter substrate-binding protein n=1 Tax=Pseudoroseomonas ludipueritiae TaxID=198093 RepID=UPI002AA5310C
MPPRSPPRSCGAAPGDRPRPPSRLNLQPACRPATNDLMAGTISIVGDTATTGLGQARGGVLRALAVTSARRMPQAPDIPTVAESGFPGLAGYTMTSWNMLLARPRRQSRWSPG